MEKLTNYEKNKLYRMCNKLSGETRENATNYIKRNDGGKDKKAIFKYITNMYKINYLSQLPSTARKKLVKGIYKKCNIKISKEQAKKISKDTTILFLADNLLKEKEINNEKIIKYLEQVENKFPKL